MRGAPGAHGARGRPRTQRGVLRAQDTRHDPTRQTRAWRTRRGRASPCLLNTETRRGWTSPSPVTPRVGSWQDSWRRKSGVVALAKDMQARAAHTTQQVSPHLSAYVPMAVPHQAAGIPAPPQTWLTSRPSPTMPQPVRRAVRLLRRKHGPRAGRDPCGPGCPRACRACRHPCMPLPPTGRRGGARRTGEKIT